MSSGVEVADGVLQRRYDPLDVNVCVVRRGLLLVDTRSCPRAADEMRADLAALGPAAVRCVVNTHAHYDHTFGDQRFGPGSDLDLPVCGHWLLAKHLDEVDVVPPAAGSPATSSRHPGRRCTAPAASRWSGPTPALH
jgi:glyoxylase-like metal-dependent hydrolase (beta-lactamase superfamily II)